MATQKLAIVLHGVNTRSSDKFQAVVQEMHDNLKGKTKDQWIFYPVFWGDMGVEHDDIATLVPELPERSKSIGTWLFGGIWHLIAGYAGGTVAAVFKLGNAVRHAIAGNQEMARKIFGELEADNEWMANRGYDYWWEAFDLIRAPISRQALKFVGDVIVYSNSTRRLKIQNRIFQIVDRIDREIRQSRALELGQSIGSAESPVTVIAHSLGGVIAFELATRQGRRLWIDHFITMGSQPGFFYRADPSRYRQLSTTSDGKLVLPATVQRWTNIVEPFDVLSFPARGNFVLHNGSEPNDIVHRVEIGPRSHGVYWRQYDLIARILNAT